MTTTEKIKVMQAFEDGQAVQWRGRLSDAEWKDVSSPELSWNWEMNEYRIKPPDPEQLECWVNVYSQREHGACWLSHDEAKENASKNAIRTAHMREVTPQMLENEKDAARFRRLVEMAGVAWQPGDTEWCQAVPGNLLREEIDKAGA